MIILNYNFKIPYDIHSWIERTHKSGVWILALKMYIFPIMLLKMFSSCLNTILYRRKMQINYDSFITEQVDCGLYCSICNKDEWNHSLGMVLDEV